MKTCLVTQAYFTANEELIRGLVAGAGVYNYSFPLEGELRICRGVNPEDLPATDIWSLPAPTEDEDMVAWGAAAVGAYNAVKNGPTEVFFMENERNIHDCRHNANWPKSPEAP